MSTKSFKNPTLQEYREVIQIIKGAEENEKWLANTKLEINGLIKSMQSISDRIISKVKRDPLNNKEISLKELEDKVLEIYTIANDVIDFITHIPNIMTQVEMKTSLITDYVKFKNDSVEIYKDTRAKVNKLIKDAEFSEKININKKTKR